MQRPQDPFALARDAEEKNTQAAAHPAERKSMKRKKEKEVQREPDADVSSCAFTLYHSSIMPKQKRQPKLPILLSPRGLLACPVGGRGPPRGGLFRRGRKLTILHGDHQRILRVGVKGGNIGHLRVGLRHFLERRLHVDGEVRFLCLL